MISGQTHDIPERQGRRLVGLSRWLVPAIVLTIGLGAALEAGAQNVKRLSSTRPPGSIEIRPGQNIQTAITNNPAGSTFYVRAGTYRIPAAGLLPKTGNTFIAERTTSGGRRVVLSGARILTGWTQSGSVWYVTSQSQEGNQASGIVDCAESAPGSGVITHPRCFRPEDLFFDGTTQKYHEDALGDVGPGEYFFDYTADRIYVGDNPAGHTVETSVTPALWAATSNVDDVTLRGFIVEKFASPDTDAAVVVGTGATGSDNWIVEDNEIRYNHGGGVGCYPYQACLVRRNYIHHNGYAVLGSGNGIRIEDNELAYNNLVAQYTPAAGTAVDETRVAGLNDYNGASFKLVFTIGSIVRGNYGHHNKGPAIWHDIQNTDAVIAGNRLEWNHRQGIFYEISCNAVIRDNYAAHNGTGADFAGGFEGAAIHVVSSPNVEVFGNTVEDNWLQIFGLNDNRRGATGQTLCPTYGLASLNVHDNVTRSTVAPASTYLTGVLDSVDLTAYSAGNVFQNNTYILSGSPTGFYFAWIGGPISDAAWQGTYGHDTTGTIIR